MEHSTSKKEPVLQVASRHFPRTPAYLAKQFTCLECGSTRPGSDFVTRSEPHPDFHIKVKPPNTHRKREVVIHPKHVQLKGKLIIDIARCAGCKAKSASKRNAAKQKAEREAEKREREALLAHYKREGIEVPSTLLPRTRQLRLPKTVNGVDPVLAALGRLLDHARTRERLVTHRNQQALDNARTRGRPASDNLKQPPVNPYLHFLKWQRRLYQARQAVFTEMRERRRVDLLDPVTAADPLRLYWKAYITEYERRTLTDIAERCNRYACCEDPAQTYRGRPFRALPQQISLRMRDAPLWTDTLRAQWAPFVEGIKVAIHNSKVANRSRHLPRAQRASRAYAAIPRVSKTGKPPRRDNTWMLPDGQWFTLDTLHTLRILAAETAARNIEHAIDRQQTPLDWLCPWTGEQESVTAWRQLVPPEYQHDMKMMLSCMPEGLAARITLYPTVRRGVGKKRFQIANGLDANNVRLPEPPPALIGNQGEA